MFLLERPTPATIARVLADGVQSAFSYQPVGVTRGNDSTSLRRTHHRVKLGTGERAFNRAVSEMTSWRMYDNGWTEIHPASAPIERDSVYATVVHHLGFWSVNPCRVVYHEQADGDVKVDAFAIGTLGEHAERGEERFQVEWHRADDSVWFDILAFAEPRHWLAVLGTPIVWSLQRRFAKDAMMAMRRALTATPSEFVE